MSDAALPLFGHGDAQVEFLSARQSGRLHHAWIIEGPSGIGKARFALRLASILLGASPLDDDPAGAPPTDPVVQKILASGHPDLKHVQREENDKGVLKQDISVDQIRNLNQFFSLKPAMGGWRIGILDSLDEMNVSGLNAVLKTLEEPPANALLFLISHATAPVLPTIRSRCQTLRLRKLDNEDTHRVLLANDVENPDNALSLVKGRPGRAADLLGPKVLAAAHAAHSLLKALPSANESVISSAISAAGEDDASFRVFSEELLDWLGERANNDPEWAEVWTESQKIIALQRNFHMPAIQAAAKLVASIQTAFATR